MEQQFICAAGICALLLLCTVAKSQETVGELQKLNTQNSANIFIIMENVDRLLTEVEVLNKKSNTQTNVLKVLQEQTTPRSSDDGVCDPISSFFNSTLSKYNEFENSIVDKLNEIQDEQSTNLNKILDVQNLTENCPQSEALSTMSEALSEMSEKIDNLETQLKSYQTSNGEQMELLKEIHAKLMQHHDRFEIFEKELPNVVQVKVEEKSPKTKQTVPMNIILGMTQQHMRSRTE